MGRNRLHNDGLSRVTFFLGVMNVGFTGFLLGRFPQHTWVLYIAKSAVYVPSFLFQAVQKHSNGLLILDYCWFSNILLSCYMLVILIMGPHLSRELRRWGFLAFYAASMGPLSWTGLASQNGLIFHSVEKTAVLFIHLTPSLVSWTLRWLPELISASWPERFPEDELVLVRMDELYIAGFVPYMVWFVLHSLWLLTIGIHCPSQGCNTAFGNLYSKYKLEAKFTSMLGCSGLRCHAATFMLLQWTATMVSFLWSILCYNFFFAHTAFEIILYSSAAWHCSDYYNHMLTAAYPRALDKLIIRGAYAPPT